MVAKTKNLCFIAFYLLVGGCYNEKFAEIPDSVTIKPAIALPLAIGAFTIDKSLVLYGVPEINLDEDLPSWAQQKRVAFHDTLSFAISGIEKEVEEIISLTINLIVYNDFPSSAEIQVFFLNEEFEKNDSLFVPSRLVVNPGEIDGFGRLSLEAILLLVFQYLRGKSICLRSPLDYFFWERYQI